MWCAKCFKTFPSSVFFCPDCGSFLEDDREEEDNFRFSEEDFSPSLSVPNLFPNLSRKPVSPMSTVGIFCSILLYSIPIIGWVLALISSFSEKNHNRRNLARAILICHLLCVSLLCLWIIITFFIDRESLLLVFKRITGAEI